MNEKLEQQIREDVIHFLDQDEKDAIHDTIFEALNELGYGEADPSVYVNRVLALIPMRYILSGLDHGFSDTEVRDSMYLHLINNEGII